MQIHLLFFIAFLNLVRINRADDYGWGECPKVNPVSNFDFTKFSGLWYVIQKFDLSSPCWTYYFVNQNGIRKVIQSQNQTINQSEPEKTPGNIGTLEIVNATEPGFMSVRFSDNILGKADYTVYFTDYENYGAIFRCQKVLFGHRRSATILSRQPYLTPSLRNQARAKLVGFGIDISSFKSVDPMFCKNPMGASGETVARRNNTQEWFWPEN